MDYNEVARYFGEGTTYNSIEAQFRTIRDLADKLKAEAGDRVAPKTPSKPRVDQNGDAATMNSTGSRRRAANGSAPNSRKRGSTAKKDGVLTGRITKPDPDTPSRPSIKRENSIMGFKQEVESSEQSPAESFFSGAAGSSDMAPVAFGKDDDVDANDFFSAPAF